MINNEGEHDPAENGFKMAGRREVPELEKLHYNDPSHFVVGHIHHHYDSWQFIFENIGTDNEVRE